MLLIKSFKKKMKRITSILCLIWGLYIKIKINREISSITPEIRGRKRSLPEKTEYLDLFIGKIF